MAKIPLFSYGDATVLPANTTQYASIGNSQLEWTTTESQRKVRFRSAGVLSDLTITITANDRGAGTLITRKNGGNGGQSVAIPSSTTGQFTDNSNTDTVAAGDDINLALTPGAGGTTFVPRNVTIAFAATSNTVTKFTSGALMTYGSDSTTNWIYLGASGNRSSDANTPAWRMKTGGTFKGFFAIISSNARTTTTTMGFSKNGAAGSQVFSIGSGATGFFEDASNTDTVAVDDTVSYYITTLTGGGTIFVRNDGIDFVTTNNQFHAYASFGTVLSANTTYYLAPSGRIENINTSETPTQTLAKVAFTASKMQCYLSANTVTATSTLKFRKNGADGSQSISIGSGATGWFLDSSNTDTVAATDNINYQIVTGATGTSLAMRSLGFLGEIAGDTPVVSTIPPPQIITW